jgi:hypothetical protein
VEDCTVKGTGVQDIGCGKIIKTGDPENGCFQVAGVRWGGLKVRRIKGVTTFSFLPTSFLNIAFCHFTFCPFQGH